MEAGVAEGTVERFTSSSSACLEVALREGLWVAGNLDRCRVNCGGLFAKMMRFMPETRTFKTVQGGRAG